MTLKVAQISDCHVGADPGTPYRGQDAAANLRRVWEAARKWQPDLVLLTGDVSEDASPASYQKVRDILGADTTILSLPGNHDDPGQMQAYFRLGPWNGPLAFETGNWLLVLLDSTMPRRVEGGFSDADLEQLQTVLAGSDRPHVLIALHHQPIPVDAPWIDRYALTRPDRFLEIVDAEPRVRCVVWGHIHHHFHAVRHDVVFLGAPSSAANSLPRSQKFQVDPDGPACRTLELEATGEVRFGQLRAGAG